MVTLTPQRVSAENFLPYGLVVAAPEGPPTSESPEYRFWSDIARYDIEGETEIGLCTVYRRSPSVFTGMERHLRTPEILIPVDAPFILPLLLDGEDVAGIRAFEVHPGEAVVVHRGVWHAACVPVGRRASTYFVIFRRGTPHEDVAKREMEPCTLA